MLLVLKLLRAMPLTASGNKVFNWSRFRGCIFFRASIFLFILSALLAMPARFIVVVVVVPSAFFSVWEIFLSLPQAAAARANNNSSVIRFIFIVLVDK